MYPTDTRLRLLANGYSPIPNRDKQTFCKGWPHLEISEEMIRSWETGYHRRDHATGVRLDNRLIVIDVDINDSEMIGRLMNTLIANDMPQVARAPTRYGSGDKEAWFFRLADGEELFRYCGSTGHVLPGQDPEDDRVPIQRVEVWGGIEARQFGVYGPHTVSDTGEVKIRYEWYAGNGDLLSTPLRDLPTITVAEIVKLTTLAGNEMANAAWPRVRRVKEGAHKGGVIYSLTDDMTFDCADGVTRTLEQMHDYAATGGARCSAGWLEGQGAQNLTRCLVTLTHDDKLRIVELASYDRYMCVDDREETAADKAAKLAERMAAVGVDLSQVPAPAEVPDRFVAALEELMTGWVFAGNRQRACLPIFEPEANSMTLANLRGHFKGSEIDGEPGPNGGKAKKKINPVDVWYNSPERITGAIDYRFCPGKPRGIVEVNGERCINSFVPFSHAAEPSAKATADWIAFLEHLLPHEGEREWFMDWIAHKAQNLHVPGVAVLLQTPTKGTGRGTLSDILTSVFGGARYVRSLTMDQLVGDQSQSQYNDWLAGRLLISVEEVLQDGDDSSNMQWKRRKSTERLKTFLDPRVREMQIIRKGLPSYIESVHASFLLATNHPDALALDADDRRVAVLRCTRTPLPTSKKKPAVPELLGDRVHAYGPNSDYSGEMAASVWHWAMERDVSTFNAQHAPDWGGKTEMIAANRTELDDLIDDVLQNWPHDWADRATFGTVVERRAAAEGLDKEYRSIRRRATDKLQSAWNAGPPGYMAHVGQKGNRRVICFRTEEERARFESLPITDRGAEMEVQSKGNVTPKPELLAARLGLGVIEGDKK